MFHEVAVSRHEVEKSGDESTAIGNSRKGKNQRSKVSRFGIRIGEVVVAEGLGTGFVGVDALLGIVKEVEAALVVPCKRQATQSQEYNYRFHNYKSDVNRQSKWGGKEE